VDEAMKHDNGHREQETAENGVGLQSQVANAVGELLRAQQQIELQKRTFEERDADLVARERALVQREEDGRLRQARLDDVTASLQSRAVELDGLAANAIAVEQRLAARKTEIEALGRDLAAREQELAGRLTALEAKEAELTAADDTHRDFEARERDHQERERQAEARERQFEAREQEAEAREQEIAAREARLLELCDREAVVEQESQALQARAATLADNEAQLASHWADLERRETAIKQFCSVLSGMAHALQDPCPEKLEAARAAADAIAGEQRLCIAPPIGANVAKIAAPCAQDCAENEVACETSPSLRGEDGPADTSDFSPEELQHFGMLRKLGTATDREIAESIRAQRSSAPSRKRKRRWL
jgi:chromosome segregation ATPase